MQGLTHVGDLVMTQKIFLLSVALTIFLVSAQTASEFKETVQNKKIEFDKTEIL